MLALMTVSGVLTSLHEGDWQVAGFESAYEAIPPERERHPPAALPRLLVPGLPRFKFQGCCFKQSEMH